MESYYESAKGHTLTRKEVWQVFKGHSQSYPDYLTFLMETGYQETYDAQAVLVWLGY